MLAINIRKKIRDEGKVNRVSRYTLRDVGNGMTKCMECGMVITDEDVYTHGAFHKGYSNMCEAHEETLSEYAVEKYTRDLRGKINLTEEELGYIEEMEFTGTLRSWDYGNKKHPVYVDYINLLWSTIEFRKEIKGLISEELYNKKIKEHSSNRCLRIIGDFGLITIKECVGVNDLSHLDKLYLREVEEDDIENEEHIEYITNEEEFVEFVEFEDIKEEEIGKVIEIDRLYRDEDAENEEYPEKVKEILKIISI